MFLFAIGISAIGDWLNILALMSYFTESQGSRMVAILFTCRTIPGIFIGFFLSDWIAHLPIKSTLKIISLFQALIVGILAYTVLYDVYFTLIITVILSCLSAMITPIVRGSVPLLVSNNNLASFNAKLGIIQSTGYVVAPAISGIIVSIFGIRTAFFIDIMSFIIFTGLIKKISFQSKTDSLLSQKHPEHHTNIRTWNMVFEIPELRIVGVGLLIASFVIATIHATEISYFKEVLNVSGDKYGLFVSFAGFGALGGTWIAGRIICDDKIEVLAFYLGVIALGVVTFLFALSTNIIIATILMVASGFSEGFYSVLFPTIVQRRLGEKATAAFSIFGGISTASMFFGRFFSVLSVESLSPKGTLMCVGAIATTFCLSLPFILSILTPNTFKLKMK